MEWVFYFLYPLGRDRPLVATSLGLIHNFVNGGLQQQSNLGESGHPKTPNAPVSILGCVPGDL